MNDRPYCIARCAGLLFALSLLRAASLPAQEPQILDRVVETFQPQNWRTASDTRVAADLEAIPEGMRVNIPFSGKGFEFYKMELGNPIAIPGELAEISFRIRMSDPGSAVKVVLAGGHGRQRDLDVQGIVKNEWATAKVRLPDDLVQPATVKGFLFHNYGTRNQKTDVRVELADMAVKTDLSKADPQSGRYLEWAPDPKAKDVQSLPETPLLTADFGSTAPGNFFAGTEPELTLSVRNWRPEPAKITAGLTVTDENGNVVYRDTKDVRVEAAETLSWKPEIEKYGPYRAALQLKREGGETRDAALRMAKAPAQPELIEEQKQASPYGMNYHAGHGLLLEPFRAAGIVWFRDYAFTWSWLERAKGDNYSFAGWPGYPGIIKTYQDAGAMLMPCLMGAIPRPAVEEGEVKGAVPPDRDWASHLVSVLLGFPHIQYWELDNEYALDGEVRRAETLLGWSHYQTYHERFGDIVATMGQGELLAVENGRAGIHPDLLADAIDSGAFDSIDVANIHHYCGVDAPEENVKNYNTGGQGRNASSYFDKLRDTVTAADRDGKDRQVFITEFGWDTLAGQVVSEEQQAAYLARAYMMHAAAGLDKSFWYWHFDSGATASTFFGGCGLMTHLREPKPALSAMAGLTSMLPQLNYVGNFNAGPGTLGYVFEQDGAFVAALWRIHAGENPIEFDFGHGAKLRDIYGNPLPGTKTVLGISPVYAVGVDKESALMKQTAYSIASDEYMPTTAGEEARVRIAVHNRENRTLTSRFEIKVPEGWPGLSVPVHLTVEPGETAEAVLNVGVPDSVSTGVFPLVVTVSESDENGPVKTLPLQANVQQPFFLSIGTLPVTPGVAELTATVENQANTVKSPEISLSLPESWEAVSGPVVVENLEPGERREVTMRLRWDPEINEGETALLRVGTDRASVAEPIIPPVIRIHKLDGKGRLDGDRSRWPEKNRIPGWMLGSTYGEPRTGAWVGWTEAGLWFAFEVRDSKVYVTDPRSFWTADVLEIFLDTENDKTAVAYASGDHQFWTVAQPETDSVYLGQWKRGNEIEATRFDIESVRGASSVTDTGYVMEFLIPWSELSGAAPQPGTQWGLNLNLSVKGTDGDREVYWPRRKDGDVMNQPKSWGSVKLVE